MNFGVVAAIARKDIVDAIRNRYLLVALMTPLFVAILFRVLLPGIDAMKQSTIVVHDLGESRLVAELRASPQVKLINAGSAEAVPNEVENSKAAGGLAIPPTFDADVAAGKQPQLTAYTTTRKASLNKQR